MITIALLIVATICAFSGAWAGMAGFILTAIVWEVILAVID